MKLNYCTCTVDIIKGMMKFLVRGERLEFLCEKYET